MFPSLTYSGTVAQVLLLGVVCFTVVSFAGAELLPHSKISCLVYLSPSSWRQSVLAVWDPGVQASRLPRPAPLQQTRRRPCSSPLTAHATSSCLSLPFRQRPKRPLETPVSLRPLLLLGRPVPTFHRLAEYTSPLIYPRPMHVASGAVFGQPAFLLLSLSRVTSLAGSLLQKGIFFHPYASGNSSSRLLYSRTVSHLFSRASPSHYHHVFSTMGDQISDSGCTHEGAQEKMVALTGSTRHPIPLHGSGSGRVRIAALLSDEYAAKLIGQVVTVCGWSRSVRKQGGGSLCFLVLSDGSGPGNLQVVVDCTIGESFAQLLKCGAGCSFRVRGEVVKSPAKGQALELSVRDPQKDHRLEILGMTDASKYPLAKKEHTREYLREIAHLRPRSQLMGALARVRSQLAMATHQFFQDRGFLYIHTPIITASDCEGAGEMFQVTTILPAAAPAPAACSAKRQDGDVTETSDGKTEAAAAAKLPPTTRTGEVDYSKDFFGRRAFLTVSGQLNVEPYCCALGDVYTFGPTFRAENSHTSRHLAEFWMVEPEIAFATLEDNMRVAEEYVKYCVRWVLDNCRDDIQWFEKNQEEGLLQRLDRILAEPFARVTYTDAIELLKAAAPKANFKEAVSWGMDLGSEHERYLTEQIYKKPCIVHDYPKEIKAFYMKLNDDARTVRAMDVLVPKIGELIGGSQREDNLELLDKMIVSKGLDPKNYWWYRELRSYGSVPHAGFGLGFERLVMLVTGVENIRDTVAYPRYPGHAEY